MRLFRADPLLFKTLKQPKSLRKRGINFTPWIWISAVQFRFRMELAWEMMICPVGTDFRYHIPTKVVAVVGTTVGTMGGELNCWPRIQRDRCFQALREVLSVNKIDYLYNCCDIPHVLICTSK